MQARSINTSALHQAVVERLLEMLRAKTGQAGADWTSATTLEDAGIDSFDMVEYIFEIEDEFNISIDFNANLAKDIPETVGDLAAMIEGLLRVRLAA